MSKDYYTTLGVHRNASVEAIQKAYHALARKYHPDLNPDDPQAEERFKEIQAAFEVLSDPERRAAYNRTIQSSAAVRRHRENSEDTRQLSARLFRRTGSHSPHDWREKSIIDSMKLATFLWLSCSALGLLFVLAASLSGGVEEESAFELVLGGLCCCSTPLYLLAMILLLRKL